MQSVLLGRQVQTTTGRGRGNEEPRHQGAKQSPPAIEKDGTFLRCAAYRNTLLCGGVAISLWVGSGRSADGETGPRFLSFLGPLLPSSRGLLSPLFPRSPPYEATARAGWAVMRGVPLRGPRLRALITLMRSSSSWGEQVFLASSASAPWSWSPIFCGSPRRIMGT